MDPNPQPINQSETTNTMTFSTPGGDEPREPTMTSIEASKHLVIPNARELDAEALTDKEVVKKVKTDIPNLTCILKQAFKKLSQAKDKEIVVAIGNSAAGKSTMLTSLIYGPQSLKLTVITEKKMGPGGKEIERKEEVIDWTDGFK